MHYLGNKKSTFLACNTEDVYAAILEFTKNNDLFQNRQTYSRRNFPKFSRHGFCKNAYKKVKTSKDGRHLLKFVSRCKEIVCNNTKEHINLVICGATVSLLFWSHLDSQSFKIIRKFYLPHPNFLSLLAGVVM